MSELRDLKSADEIIKSFSEKDSTIEFVDCGNLHYAATEYQDAYKDLEAEIADLKKENEFLKTIIAESNARTEHAIADLVGALKTIAGPDEKDAPLKNYDVISQSFVGFARDVLSKLKVSNEPT